jgi:hypothetical protein
MYLFWVGTIHQCQLSFCLSNLDAHNVCLLHSAKAYECAKTSETSMCMQNQQMRYFLPLRDQQQRACFVLEIESGEIALDENKLEREQVETVFYVLEKCSDELVAEHYAVIRSNAMPMVSYAFEREYDNDKCSILFEKAYVSFVIRRLMSSVQSSASDELPASADYVDLIKLIAELIGYQQLVETRIINEAMLALMINYDPTAASFQFTTPSDANKFDITTENYTSGKQAFQLRQTFHLDSFAGVKSAIMVSLVVKI